MWQVAAAFPFLNSARLVLMLNDTAIQPC